MRTVGLHGAPAPDPAHAPAPDPAHAPATDPAHAPATDLLDNSALALSAALHSRKISCVELMQACLARIDALNPAFNAIVSLRPHDELLAEASAHDALLAQGQSKGWLHGIPQAIKDLASVQGLRSTRGSPLFATHIPGEDALVVHRMRQAGAILIGKTNTPEFGLGSHTFNPVFGATRNAWDPQRSAGGSSGGAAVALALRMLAVADGSDMGGSLRNPAAWNHVFGLRPSQGRVPKLPSADPFFLQLGTEGPMGRDVADIARLLATQSGYHPQAPLSLGEDARDLAMPLPAGDLACAALRGKKIGWLADLGGHLGMEDGVLDVCGQALAHFSAMGAVVEPAQIAFDPEALWQAWLCLRQCAVAMELLPHARDPAQRALLKAEACWEVDQALQHAAIDLMRASAVRAAFFKAWLEAFDRWDFLALPSAQVFPFAVDASWPRTVGARRMDTYHRWMEVAIYATLGGSPAISLPAGFGTPARPSPTDPEQDASAQQSHGLPMGLQLIAAPRQDRALLEAAHAYAYARGAWIHRKPLSLQALTA